MAIKLIIATPILAFILAVAFGGLTGRIRARSCCAPPPDQDLRLRDP